MPTPHTSAESLSPELEAIATAAAGRLHALAAHDPSTAAECAQQVADAASAAIHAGASLTAIAHAEQMGEQRARDALRGDLLRCVQRAARKKRDADTDLDTALSTAAALGLSSRELATAAEVPHSTVRAALHRLIKTASENGTVTETSTNGQVSETGTPPALAA